MSEEKRSRLGEAELEALEKQKDPAIIPELIRIIRDQQHEIDRLRLSNDVTQRDREELRAALMQARRE